MGDLPAARGYRGPMSGDDFQQPPIEPYRPPVELDPTMRRRAIKRLEARRDFRIHASVYTVFMVFFTLIWVVSGVGYFWPIWPMLGWGLGLGLHGLSLRWDNEPSEKEIADEAQKLRRIRGADGPQD